MKWQKKVRNMPKKRLPAIVDKAVWEKVPKGRAGTRWDSVAGRIYLVGGNQEEMMSADKFARYKTDTEERMERRERLALRNTVESEKHFRDKWGVERRDRNENVFARPDGLRENAETAISRRGPGPARKKKEEHQ